MIDPQLLQHGVMVERQRGVRDLELGRYRVVAHTLVRPLPFYAIVSTLIGYTVLFVISKVGGAGVRPDGTGRSTYTQGSTRPRMRWA